MWAVRSVISYISHRSRRRRRSSCMSDALEVIFSAVKCETMLSVSTSTVRPRASGPHLSITLSMPNSSRQLIGRLCSARVNRSTSSSTSPPMKAS